MRKLGWVDGENMVVERRYGESVDELRAGAADLVRQKVDVLFVTSGSLAKIVQLETKTVPVVVAGGGGDLAAAGLAGSLAKPDGVALYGLAQRGNRQFCGPASDRRRL